MILGYNWQIFDYSIPQQQPLSKYILSPKPSGNQILNQPESLNSTMQAMALKCPIFSFVFSYWIEEPKVNQPQIHLFPEMSLFENKIEISLLQERKQKNYLYQLIKIQNCECFETIITLAVKIKFIEGSNSKITTIDKLISLVGSRKLNSHSFQTYSVIKKQLTIQEPLICEIRYSPKGYALIKLTRSQQSSSPVYVSKISLLTWLCQEVNIKNFQSKIIAINDKFKLSPKQSYSLMFTLPQNLTGPFQIPINILFNFESFQTHQFKIIKYLKVE